MCPNYFYGDPVTGKCAPCENSCGGCVGPAATDCSSCASYLAYLKLDNGRVLPNDTAKGVCIDNAGALRGPGIRGSMHHCCLRADVQCCAHSHQPWAACVLESPVGLPADTC